MSQVNKCSTCNGKKVNTRGQRCLDCNGTGIEETEVDESFDFEDEPGEEEVPTL